jgi:hypothetical protein
MCILNNYYFKQQEKQREYIQIMPIEVNPLFRFLYAIEPLYWQTYGRIFRGSVIADQPNARRDLFPSGRSRSVLLFMKFDNTAKVNVELGSPEIIIYDDGHITIPEFVNNFKTPNPYVAGFDREAQPTKFHITFKVLHKGNNYKLRIYGNHSIDPTISDVTLVGIDCKIIRQDGEVAIVDYSREIAESVYAKLIAIFNLSNVEFQSTILGQAISAMKEFVQQANMAEGAATLVAAAPDSPLPTAATPSLVAVTPLPIDRGSLDKLEELFKTLAQNQKLDGNLPAIYQIFKQIFKGNDDLNPTELENVFLSYICCAGTMNRALLNANISDILNELEKNLLDKYKSFFAEQLRIESPVLETALQQVTRLLQVYKDTPSAQASSSPKLR